MDGLRALAVIAVVAYHLGFGWASGGLLGVNVFFTLSGYLITDILLSRKVATGGWGLREFWLHRARRLLPAVALMLVVVTAWVTLFDRARLAHLRGDLAAAAGYVSNWWSISQNDSYFGRFGPPSPLEHLWSLAVEEQFYLVWPFLLVGGVRLVGGVAGRPRRWALASLTSLLAVGSAIEMVVLFRPGFDATRVYDGTDTRAFGLLVGAALAMVLRGETASRGERSPASGLRRVGREAFGVAALAVIAVMVARTDQYSESLYRGGLVALSVATAALIAVVVGPGSIVGRALALPGIRWIGVRSYGIYLWHYPVIVLSSSSRGVAPSFWRTTGQVVATLVLAELSGRFVEDPIRGGALGRAWARRRVTNWASPLRPGWQPVAFAMGFAVLVTACVGVSGAPSALSHRTTAASFTVPSPTRLDLQDSPEKSALQTAGRGVGKVAPVPEQLPTTTSCRSVVHIGDSTSEGLTSANYLPDPTKRIDAQYARVGAPTTIPEISGGTSVLETVKSGEQNAADVAQKLVASGYHGCWVLALGTNDTADVSVGSTLDRAGRVSKMMSIIGSQPVLWVTVKSLRTSGPYSDDNMRLWDDALRDACDRYPSMRIYDWASAAQPSWYISDGIHFTSAGYAERAQLIADGLAHAFPDQAQPESRSGSSSTTCVVN